MSCIKCDSRTDANCARLTDQHLATSCGSISHGHVDSCVTYVADGILQRGCLSEMHVLEEDCRSRADLCEMCSGAGCNQRAIKSDVCLVCDAQVDADCKERLSENSTMSAECPLSLQPLGCYHFEDGGKYFEILRV